MSELTSVIATTAELSDAEADEFRSLCMAIGFVVVNWAVIEQQIDILVNIAFKQCGGRKLRKKGDIPRSLSQKTEFLRDCFKRLSNLKEFAAEGKSLMGRADNLSIERHNLVHGAIASTISVDGKFHFRMVRHFKEDHGVDAFTFGPAEFSNLETALGDLLTQMIRFSTRVGDRFPMSPG